MADNQFSNIKNESLKVNHLRTVKAEKQTLLGEKQRRTFYFASKAIETEEKTAKLRSEAYQLYQLF